MDWITQNKWLFEGVLGLALVTFLGWLLHKFWPRSERADANAVAVGVEGNTSVAGSAIASGSHITQTVHIAETPLPLAPVPDYRPDPTPEAIGKRIQNLPVYEQSGAADSYRGVPVRWPLRLQSVDESNSEPDTYTVHLVSEPSPIMVVSVYCDVSLAHYPRLRIVYRDDPIEVSGIIDEVMSDGRVILLRDVRLAFPNKK